MGASIDTINQGGRVTVPASVNTLKEAVGCKCPPPLMVLPVSIKVCVLVKLVGGALVVGGSRGGGLALGRYGYRGGYG